MVVVDCVVDSTGIVSLARLVFTTGTLYHIESLEPSRLCIGKYVLKITLVLIGGLVQLMPDSQAC